MAESKERRAEKQEPNTSTATPGNRPQDTLKHPCMVMGGWLVAVAETHPLEKLPPPTRAIILMALLGILLLGLFLVVVILLGGNWVRKLGKHRRGPSVPPDVAPLRPRPGRNTPPPPGPNRLAASNPVEEKMYDQETEVADETKEH